ncbi:Alg9-like mannosyltransferase family-domain-containing protein [Cytidiella melzeri]|nr:Alg9-like mannosyltransferase family-domain-containing protein [Cytidiella melzeri]
MATPRPGTETIRFRRPTNQPSGDKPSAPSIRKNRHAGLLQDQLRRSQKAPMCASFSLAFRIFLLVRVMGAMYSGLSDCDEVTFNQCFLNFWEPLHYLDRGHAFQTWETSPQYSIRSGAYILIHLFPAKVVTYMFGPEKRPAFFAVRVVLALVSATCEAFFYRTVVDKINYRVGRYLFFMMLFSAGMWNASVASSAFLPSSFAMYFNCTGFAYFIEPTTSTNMRRTLFATMAFATGALIGWPFSIAVALPFVFFEELFFITYFRPITAPTSMAPNLLSFYVNNLLLNTNVALPFAVLSLPALLITHRPERSSPYTLMVMRLLPMYVWFGAQPHKEERLMNPVYPFIFFNAAVEVVYVAYTKSSYRVSIIPSGIANWDFSRLTLSVLAASVVISVTRGIALYHYYRALMALMNHFEAYEIPLDEDEPRIAYDLMTLYNLTLCSGKEWHRFPGSYLIKSEFDGMLPGHFKRTPTKGGLVSRIHGTRVVPGGLNNMNKEEPSFYVDVNTCDYLVDSDYPLHPTITPHELRVKCKPFLDARHLSLLTRTLWMAGENLKWQQTNDFRNMERKERVLTVHQTK